MADVFEQIRTEVDLMQKGRDAVQALLGWVGEDPQREGLADTPDRVLRALREMTLGYSEDPAQVLSTTFNEPCDELVVVRAVPFVSLCVPSKQLVNTVGGAKPARNVRVGDVMWAIDDHGALVRTTVNNVTAHPSKDVWELRAGRHRITLTGNHPVMTPDGWVPMRDLTPGMKVRAFSPRAFHRVNWTVNEGYDLGYILGAVGSDGSVQDGRRISLCVKDERFARKYAAAWFNTFGQEVTPQLIEVPSGFLGRHIPMWRVRSTSSWIAQRLLWWFGGSKATANFKFPRVVLRSPEMLRGFLDGYVDGDGFEYRNHRYIVSSNFDFLDELGAALKTTPGSESASGYAPTRRLAVPSHLWRDARKPRQGDVDYDNEIPLLPEDASWAEIDGVSYVGARGPKPHTVVTIGCTPHHRYLVGGISVKNCEHHMMPFSGTATVGYLPSDRVVGLSKLGRIVDTYARRLQVQERMTQQIATSVYEVLDARAAGVVVRGTHHCMTCRGVRKNAQMVTSCLLGLLRDEAALRAEFLALERS